MGAPFRIHFTPLGCVDESKLREHVARSEHVQHVARSGLHGRPLAIVGGGPSINNELEALRNWSGDIWAINGAASHLLQRGIKSTLVSVDPSPLPDWMLDGVKSAILASSAHPSTFNALGDRVQKMHMVETHEGGIVGGCTTAARLPALAIYMGYSNVSFFGCEGSFIDADHAYNDESKDPARECQLIIRTGQEDHKTYPEFMLQSQSLAQLIVTFPDAFKERSGGLLAGMVAHWDDWSVVGISASLKHHLEEINGNIGLYDKAYQPI